MAGVLTADQIVAFRRDGFLILRGLFSPADVGDQERWIDEIATRPPEVGRQVVYYEDSLKSPGARVLARIEKFSEHHARLGGLGADPRLIRPIADLLSQGRPLVNKK